MKIESNGLSLEFYNSIKDLPNYRHFKAKSFQLWYNSVGNTLDSIRSNLVKAIEFIAYDKKSDAIICIQNADLGLEVVMSDEDFEIKELICYIKSINGKHLGNKLSDGEIEEIYDKVLESEFGYDILIETLNAIKKK